LRVLGGAHAKIDAEELRRAAVLDRGDVHSPQAACVSITQITEAGAAYSLPELQEIGRIARHAGLRVHMDGARFANAVATLGCSPADMTWRVGVDVLSFGATKNGAPGVEAIVAFDRNSLEELQFRRKRAGHLASKMRFLAAQMDAYLEGDLWLRCARHANAMAARLAAGLAAVPGVSIVTPVQGNLMFVRFPGGVAQALLDQGFHFYADRRDPSVHRLVTAFATRADAVDELVQATVRAVDRHASGS